MHDAFIAIDNRRIIVFSHGNSAFGLSHNRNPHGARNDHNMARRGTVFEHHAA